MRRLFVYQLLYAEKVAAGAWPLFHLSIFAIGSVLFLQKFSVHANSGKLVFFVLKEVKLFL